MHPWSRTMAEEKIKLFIELTEAALHEADSSRFIDCLMKRESITANVFKNLWINEGEAREYLTRERVVLKRLEKEKKAIIEAMDNLSKTMQASRVYTKRFPFPFMPKFIDRKG